MSVTPCPAPDADGTIESNETMTEKQKTRLLYLSERAGISFEEAVAKKMSQRQLKKMASQLRYKEILHRKRKEEREKRKKFRSEMKSKDMLVQKPKKEIVLMKDSENKVSVVIDLDFTDLMSDADLRKLRKQIMRCYSMNRVARAPVQLYLTSCGQKVRDELSGSGFASWDIHVTDQSYLQLFETEDKRKSLIYLTRDSENVLPDATVIKSDPKVYVIGGLVDHNAHKGLTLSRSQSQGISHARLPIDEHIKMCRTQVLTVNQVFELLLLTSQGMTGWTDALEEVIPQRKIHPHHKQQAPESEEQVPLLQSTPQQTETCSEVMPET